MSGVPVVVTLLTVAGAYLSGVRRLWRRGGPDTGVHRLRAAAFLMGTTTVAVALLSPLEAMAHATFSMHMVQHVLLLVVAPPLVVAGTPVLPLLWSLPPGGRLRVGRAWRRARRVRGLWRLVSGPAVAGLAAAVVLWVWHLPSLYQAALAWPVLHAVEHVTLFASSGLLWWAILRPLGAPRAHGGGALLLVFATKVQTTVLAALIAFASRPLYPVYESGTAAAGRTLVQDQQLAAIVMGWPMALVYVAAAAGVFLAWMRRIDRHVERRPHRPPGVVPGRSG